MCGGVVVRGEYAISDESVLRMSECKTRDGFTKDDQVGRRPRLARTLHRVGALPWVGRLRAALRGDLRILAYHRVLDSVEPEGFRFDLDLISASAEAFRRQLAVVKRRCAPMRFDELLDSIERGRPLPRRATLITFDDGYDDNYRIAFPLLREAGLSAMFFVSTGHLDSGRPFGYDWLVHMLCTSDAERLVAPEIGIDQPLPGELAARRALGRVVLDRIKLLDAASQQALIDRLQRDWRMPDAAGHADCRPLSWAQVREMHAAGMEIGGHGVDHRMLAKMPVQAMREEIAVSYAALTRELGAPPLAMSYPVGGSDAFDDAVAAAVRDTGFKLACSYQSGAESLRAATRYGMLRLPVERGMCDAWFEAMLSWPEAFCYPTRSRQG